MSGKGLPMSRETRVYAKKARVGGCYDGNKKLPTERCAINKES